MDLNIDGNVALVSASSSGLGKATAEAFATEGANVVVNGRNEDRLADAVEELAAVGPGTVVGHRGDLTDPDDVTALVERTVGEFGGVDHLVTNAGGPPSGPFLAMDDEDWYDAFDLLVMSVVRLVRASVDHLRAGGGGTIVTITSRSVKEAIDSLVLSNAVRMSVVGLEKTLSSELAPEIRSNAVLPGPHETARQRSLVEAGVERGEYDSYEDGLEARASDIPVGSMGSPDDFGDVVAFLSSPRAAHIDGAAIPVDGGAGASNL
jgi:NAD(P)-dependent dehydrogenase (short-subunit alcohol dehydrogenase family)